MEDSHDALLRSVVAPPGREPCVCVAWAHCDSELLPNHRLHTPRETPAGERCSERGRGRPPPGVSVCLWLFPGDRCCDTKCGEGGGGDSGMSYGSPLESREKQGAASILALFCGRKWAWSNPGSGSQAPPGGSAAPRPAVREPLKRNQSGGPSIPSARARVAMATRSPVSRGTGSGWPVATLGHPRRAGGAERNLGGRGVPFQNPALSRVLRPCSSRQPVRAAELLLPLHRLGAACRAGRWGVWGAGGLWWWWVFRVPIVKAREPVPIV